MTTKWYDRFLNPIFDILNWFDRRFIGWVFMRILLLIAIFFATAWVRLAIYAIMGWEHL